MYSNVSSDSSAAAISYGYATDQNGSSAKSPISSSMYGNYGESGSAYQTYSGYQNSYYNPNSASSSNTGYYNYYNAYQSTGQFVSEAPVNNYYSSSSTTAGYNYNAPYSYQQPKPSTPSPTIAQQLSFVNQQTTVTSDSTPEKLNDSGVDVISPSLPLNSSSSAFPSTNSSFNSSVNYQQQQQQSQSSVYNQVYAQTTGFPSQHYASYDRGQYTQQQLYSSTVPIMTSEDERKKALESEEKKEQKDSDLDEDNEEEEEEEENEEEEEEADEEEQEKQQPEEIKKTAPNKENKSKTSSSSDLDPSKPPKPYLEIIADAILSSNNKMMQLHEIYYFMEKKYQYFAKNVNKSWRNSVRHNLSLNECFAKAGRGSNGKGNYWKIHDLCLKEFMRGNFRRKSFKQAIRAGLASNPSLNYASSNLLLPTTFPRYTLPLNYELNQKTLHSILPTPLLINSSSAQSSSANSSLSSSSNIKPKCEYSSTILNDSTNNFASSLLSFNQQENLAGKHLSSASTQNNSRYRPY